MNRLDRFRFGTLHKRRIFLFIVILAAAILMSSGFLAMLGVFGQRSELVRVKLSSDLEGSYNGGIGINLSSIPSANRIEDHSFERGTTYMEHTVADTASEFIFLENSDELPSFNFGSSCYVRVMSVGNDGVMSEKYNGRVIGFDEAGLGRAYYAEDPDDIIGDSAPRCLYNIAGQYVALTQEGNVITGVFADVPEKIETDEVFTDMVKVNETLYLLSTTGNIYISMDGVGISLLYSFDDPEGHACALDVIGSTVCVIFDDGKIMSISSDNVRITDLSEDTGSDVSSEEASDGSFPLVVTYVYDDTMVACCASSVYVTRNGLFFGKVDSADAYIGDRRIIDATYADGAFLLLCDDSSVVRLNVTDDSVTCFRYALNGIRLRSIQGVDSGLLTAVADDGRAVIIEGDRYMEIEPSGSMVYKIYGGTSERLPVFGSDGLYLASVLSGVQVSEPIPSDSILEGDMCIFESPGAAASSELWHTVEPDTSFTVTDSFSSDLDYSACISGQSDGRHSIYYDLGDLTSFFSANNFYRMSLQIRGSNMSGREVFVWISGSDGGFGNVGFTIDDLTDRFTLKDYVFAVTENMVRAEEDLRLNISWEGSGMIYIDDLYLGEDKYGSDDVPLSVTNVLGDCSPCAVRLDCLDIASEGFDGSLFFSSRAGSLEKALCLVRDISSQPWLVIGSYADRQSTDDLLTYLAGSVSTEYGKKRLDNGTALPWSRQFDNIYIEISDSDGIFVSDSQRGAYVSYVIGLVRQSQYFPELRDRIVFLDGMEYDGGVMLSNADSHTRQIRFEGTDYPSAYEEADHESVRSAGRIADIAEYVSCLSFDDAGRPSTAAEVVSALMADSSSYIAMKLVDVPFSSRPVDSESDLIFAGNVSSDFAHEAADRMLLMLGMIKDLGMYQGSSELNREILDPLDISVGISAAEFSGDCTVRLVENGGSIYLIVANHSDRQQHFLLVSGTYRLVGSDILRYGSDGDFLIKRHVLWIDRRQSIGPGEYLVINVE